MPREPEYILSLERRPKKSANAEAHSRQSSGGISKTTLHSLITNALAGSVVTKMFMAEKRRAEGQDKQYLARNTVAGSIP